MAQVGLPYMQRIETGSIPVQLVTFLQSNDYKEYLYVIWIPNDQLAVETGDRLSAFTDALIEILREDHTVVSLTASDINVS